MRLEWKNNKRILCGHILPAQKIKSGQQWMGSSGLIVTVNCVDEFGWVHYNWIENGELVEHQKDSFSFQCRYSVIVKDGQCISDFM